MENGLLQFIEKLCTYDLLTLSLITFVTLLLSILVTYSCNILLTQGKVQKLEKSQNVREIKEKSCRLLGTTFIEVMFQSKGYSYSQGYCQSYILVLGLGSGSALVFRGRVQVKVSVRVRFLDLVLGSGFGKFTSIIKNLGFQSSVIIHCGRNFQKTTFSNYLCIFAVIDTFSHSPNPNPKRMFGCHICFS